MAFGHHHGHHHHHHGGGNGGGVLLVGLLFGSPVLIIAGIIIIALNAATHATMAVSAMGMTAAGGAAVGAGAAGATAFSFATLGIGAALIYGLAGLSYFYSAAKECFNEDKNVLDMMKSRVINEDGLSFKGIMKSIGAVLWSPFLLLGGAAGMAVRAGVNAYKGSTASKSAQNEERLDFGPGSTVQMTQTFGVQPGHDKSRRSAPDLAPTGSSKPTFQAKQPGKDTGEPAPLYPVFD